MKLKSDSGSCLVAEVFGGIFYSNIVFDSAGLAHIYSIYGSYIEMKGSIVVIAGAQYHAFAGDKGQIFEALHTITYSNNPNFSACDICSGILSEVIFAALTLTNGNTVTGTRYNAYGNGVIQTGGGGANYIPGNVAGGVTTGGLYF
jgi:hypothetical protein